MNKRKREWESSWMFSFSKALLYLLLCIGQIPIKILKKIGICLLSQNTHRRQLGGRLVNRHSHSSPFHITCFPTKLYVVNTNAIVKSTMSTINWARIPIDSNLEVTQCHKIRIFVVVSKWIASTLNALRLVFSIHRWSTSPYNKRYPCTPSDFAGFWINSLVVVNGD
jgi:hypothetical protein